MHFPHDLIVLGGSITRIWLYLHDSPKNMKKLLKSVTFNLLTDICKYAANPFGLIKLKNLKMLIIFCFE
jgi:hypothetical protein